MDRRRIYRLVSRKGLEKRTESAKVQKRAHLRVKRRSGAQTDYLSQ